ncbi:MAG: hypothetical protein RBS72_11865 [Sedimentisphaerales bacterium]|jgi:hypothetical protein|nr:hypothetical protein [Sedimentisphaerales bacterium]HOC63702.1 hypothetical protein [Sedimentisphaerales bacterium]HOH66291.1 hypothetical protein [Sedimentisphaerales bacterium]HPY48882.1 hypothetical protein [Sedimentisphaerales bacterium]HQA90262.1 hypothetical protein [Sedimentisphaerales bacterium]
MLLPVEESSLFLSLYQHLIGFAAGRLGGISGIADFASFRAAKWEAKAEARNRLLDNMALLDAFVEENPGGFRETDLSNVLLWRHFVHTDFVIERALAKCTVFLTEDKPPRAYGVLGLTQEFDDMLPCPMPVFVNAVLLPWKGRIICDGLMSICNVILGPGIRAELKDVYRRAKAAGIVMSLEPGWRPELPHVRQRPKTPAIQRFLQKKCPATLTEFKERFGMPAWQLNGEAAREFGPWDVGGSPVLDFDALAVYANIIRNRVLHVYARNDRIVYATVTRQVAWSKADCKPLPGHTLMP